MITVISRIGSPAIARVWVLLLASVVSLPLGAQSKDGDKLLASGQYREADRAFAKRGSVPAALIGRARVALATGQYQQAEKLARRAARGKSRLTALAVVAEALAAQGKHTAAIALLKQGLHGAGPAYQARALLGWLYAYTGQRALARATFDTFYDDFDAGKISAKTPEALLYVAIACRYTDNFRDASDTLADLTKSSPLPEAYAEWGEISLEKYEAGHAERHFERALKQNPNYLRALVGLGRVKLEQTNDVVAAEKLLKRALEIDPNSVAVRTVQARVLIDNLETAAAIRLLNQALTINPSHLEALATLGAAHFIDGDQAAFTRVKKRVLAINKSYTAFFHRVVSLAVRQHRYAESIALSREALKLNPSAPYVLADLGTNLLRVGRDQEGIEILKKAWEGDKYNVRTFNLLNLFEDVIDKHYTFVSSRHFRLRVHKNEAEALKRIVLPVLERAYARYVKRYAFVPTLPITVEFFTNPKHYAIRTVGLPGLAALGVCFGPVITTTSPLLGRFNWQQVLWHELNHVFTIQITRSRVPRWLTEGLADWEPTLVNAEWKRENDFDIYKALRSKRLTGIGSMNSAFTRARDLSDMVVAYYQGSLMAIYLVQRWGMPKMLQALREYGRGKRSEQILPALTGLTLEQLDQQFRQAQAQRLAFYQKSYYVDMESFRDLKRLREAADASGATIDDQAGYAAALLLHGKAKAAESQLAPLISKQPHHKLVLFLMAQLASHKRDVKGERGAWQQLIAVGGDGYQARLALGRLALIDKDLAAAKRHLDRAKIFDPERSRPYILLGAAYERSKKTAELIVELQGLAALAQQEAGPVIKLTKLLVEAKRWADVRRYGAMAYNVNPALPSLYVWLAQAYAQPAPTAQPQRAIAWLDQALLLKPEKAELARIELELARVFRSIGNAASAKQHLERGLMADPDNVELRKLKQQL